MYTVGLASLESLSEIPSPGSDLDSLSPRSEEYPYQRHAKPHASRAGGITPTMGSLASEFNKKNDMRRRRSRSAEGRVSGSSHSMGMRKSSSGKYDINNLGSQDPHYDGMNPGGRNYPPMTDEWRTMRPMSTNSVPEPYNMQQQTANYPYFVHPPMPTPQWLVMPNSATSSWSVPMPPQMQLPPPPQVQLQPSNISSQLFFSRQQLSSAGSALDVRRQLKQMVGDRGQTNEAYDQHARFVTSFF